MSYTGTRPFCTLRLTLLFGFTGLLQINVAGAMTHSIKTGFGVVTVLFLSTAIEKDDVFSCASGSWEHRRLLNATSDIGATCNEASLQGQKSKEIFHFTAILMYTNHDSWRRWRIGWYLRAKQCQISSKGRSILSRSWYGLQKHLPTMHVIV